MQCPCTISASHNLCVSYYLNLHCASYVDHGRSEDDSPKTVSYQLNTILFTEWKFLLKINKLRLGFLEMQVKTSNMKKNQLFQCSHDIIVKLGCMFDLSILEFWNVSRIKVSNINEWEWILGVGDIFLKWPLFPALRLVP